MTRTCRRFSCDRIIGSGQDVCAECRGQSSLWDAVRPSDPETSRAAAESVDVNAREREVIDALRFLVVASSTHDIQQHLAGYGLARDRNCIARRLTSLCRKGLVSDQGTKPGPHGRDCTAYRLTAQAVAA